MNRMIDIAHLITILAVGLMVWILDIDRSRA